jgi:ribosomal protein S18 acetylase RimI-like enzyme
VSIEQRSIAPTPPPPEVRLAEAADDDAVVASLVRAFRDDPLMHWAFRTGAGRDHGRAVYFHTALELYRREQAIFILPSGLGAGIWVPPGKWKLGFWRELLLTPRIMQMLGVRRFFRGLGALKRMETFHPDEPHYHLQILGVDPSLQGQGMGGHLLAAGLAHVDRQGVGTFLETANSRNLPLYRRHGFEVIHTYDFGPGSPTTWSMWRPARKP